MRILTVCTGNICRSPLAEALLQEGLNEIHPGAFEVSSAGTRARAGSPAEPWTRRIAASHGASLEQFSARALTAPLIAQADLILAMAREHRSAVLGAVPAAFRRTFTVWEFASALQASARGRALGTPGDTGAASSAQDVFRRAVAAAAERRAGACRGEDDIADPFQKGPEAYSRMAEQLVPALRIILTGLDEFVGPWLRAAAAGPLA